LDDLVDRTGEVGRRVVASRTGRASLALLVASGAAGQGQDAAYALGHTANIGFSDVIGVGEPTPGWNEDGNVTGFTDVYNQYSAVFPHGPSSYPAGHGYQLELLRANGIWPDIGYGAANFNSKHAHPPAYPGQVGRYTGGMDNDNYYMKFWSGTSDDWLKGNYMAAWCFNGNCGIP
jgi:hypothetical protein